MPSKIVPAEALAASVAGTGRISGRRPRDAGGLRNLVRSYFVQAQMFPYDYEDVIIRGTATKVDSLLLREYLRRCVDIPPRSEAPRAGSRSRPSPKE